MITAQDFMKYINKGMSVFPVMITEKDGKFEKKPMVVWDEFRRRMPTEDDVTAWTFLADFNGIGLVTGAISNVLVIDIDDPNENYGYDSSVRVKTISGGHHLYYKYRSGVRNTVRVNGLKLDIRGDGGFVVVPPSGTGDKKYTWEAWDFDKMTHFPDIERKERVVNAPMQSLPEASSGNRNDTAIKVAGHIISSIKRNSWETIGWPRFKEWNQEQCTPPLEEYELRRTFESAMSMEHRNKIEPETDSIGVYYGSEIKRKYDSDLERWGTGLTTGFADLDNWFKFLPKQIYLISSATHQGKTTLALNMSARIANEGHGVFFFSLEQGLFIAPRVETILDGNIPNTLGMLESEKLISVDSLIKTVEELAVRPELVVVDHLHFMKKDSKFGVTSAIDQMMIEIQNACKRLALPFLIIAHTRKLNEARAPELDDLRDSSSLSQIPSVVMQIDRKKSDAGVMSDTGMLYIRKNRLKGRTGSIGFKLHPNGKIELNAVQQGTFAVTNIKREEKGFNYYDN